MPELVTGVALILAVLCSLPAAAAPLLVKDLNRGLVDQISGPSLFGAPGAAAADGVVYFNATQPAQGNELWRSDGTAAGTYRLTDVCPGRCDSGPDEIRVWRGHIYFTAGDGVSGRELWRTDGIPGHESRVKDVCPGPCDANPTGFAAVGDRLWFFASVGNGQELWRTDGTGRGTREISSLCNRSPNPTGLECNFYGIQPVDDRVLFFNETLTGQEIWTSDGTAAGTVPLRQLVSGLPSAPSELLVQHDAAAFWAEDGLWRTDGTAAGTWRVKARSELTADTSPGQDLAGTAVLDGRVYVALTSGELVRSDGTPQGTHVLHRFPSPPTRLVVLQRTLYVLLQNGALFRSDGTPAGTFRLRRFPSDFVDAVTNLTPLDDDRIFFTSLRDQGFWPVMLWQTRGTPATTTEIADLSDDVAIDDDMVALGSRAVFTLFRWSAGLYELWTTDGTEAGTKRLSLVPSMNGWPTLFATKDQVFFVPQVYSLSAASQASALWVSDGTDAGTHPVRDLAAEPSPAGPLNQATLGGKLIFSAWTSPFVAPMFSSDGTTAGTLRLSSAAGFAANFSQLYGQLLFAVNTRPYVYSQTPGGLWLTDGTTAGTLRVADILELDNPLRLGNAVLFAGATGSPLYGQFDSELWRSDGTAGGTFEVKDINPFFVDTGFHHTCVGASSHPGPGVEVGGRSLFAADDGVHGRELWASDGTAAGTELVADINPRRDPTPPPGCDDRTPDSRSDSGLSSDPADLVSLGAVALLSADDGVHGRELWASDGTPGGTRLVADLRPGALGSSPRELIRVGGVVYFFASPDGVGDALYRTDGSAAGTVLVADLKVDGTASWAHDLTVSGGRLFFVVFNEATGAELWTSRGDAASTGMVIDLRPGPGSSAPQFLTDAGGGILVFAADDGHTGLEPWRSDGTAAGTWPLGDVNPSGASSSPGPFTVAGDRLFFGADDGEHGRELWAIPMSDVLARPATTSEITDLSDDVSIQDMASLGDRAVFTLFRWSARSAELWTTDGTAQGTKHLSSVPDMSLLPFPLFVMQNEVFFVPEPLGSTASALWVTDGTDAGTRVVRDFAAGQAPAGPP